MAENSFSLKIFTPAGLLLEEQVSSVTLPSAAGEIGVLPGHCKYTGALSAGILEYESSVSKQKSRLVIAGGFSTFSNDTFTVLADAVDLPGKSDLTKLKIEKEKYQAVLAGSDTLNPEWQQAKEGIARIEAIEKLS